jgi:ubiquinone/menaquinone biosynthesis C-methylase UbiE
VTSSPPLTPLAAAVLHVGRPERILQIECDEGDGALFLAREFPSARVRGVDGSPGAVRRASARVGLDPEGRIAFKQGRPRSLPFPADHFDLLAAVDALPTAAEAARVLRAGGFLALAATHGREVPAGFRGKLLLWRLQRRGFEPIWSDAAGEGGFSILRLRGGGRPGPAL